MSLKFLVAFLISFTSNAVAADFDLVRSGDGRALVSLTGEIVEGDARKYSDLVKGANREGDIVSQLYLFSPGGRVDEAIAIGRMVRDGRVMVIAPSTIREVVQGNRIKFKICKDRDGIKVDSNVGLSFYTSARIDRNCVCASACSLIWFAGVVRIGVVGVHRSYLLNAEDISFDEYEDTIAGSHEGIARYLEEMRVPKFVYEKLRATSSKELTDIEATTWESDSLFEDSVLSEYIDAKCPGVPTNTEIKIMAILEAKGVSRTRDEDSKLKELNERFSVGFKCSSEEIIRVQKQAQLGLD